MSTLFHAPRERAPFRTRRGVWLTVCLALLAGPARPARGEEQMVAVPVPAAAIYPGTPISDEQIVDKSYRESISRAAVHQNRNSVVGRTARRVLMPGRPIPITALKESEPVASGQQVTVVFAHGGIEITGRGIALQSGRTGELISVRNVDSGVVIRAVVDSDGTVHVGVD